MPLQIVELPNRDVEYVQDKENKEEILNVIIDKSSATVARLFNKSWLSRYPRAKNVVYDNRSEFKLHFQSLCDSYGLKRKPTTIKNPQSNAILERTHGVLADMLRTSGLDNSDTVTEVMIADFLIDAAWALRSTYYTVLGSTPGAAIFGRDMLYDIPYLADWTKIGKRRQDLVNCDCAKGNLRRVDFDYFQGQKVLLRKDGNLHKVQVCTNGTVRIQHGSISERLNIRRLSPYFER